MKHLSWFFIKVVPLNEAYRGIGRGENKKRKGKSKARNLHAGGLGGRRSDAIGKYMWVETILS